jgi:hypothetical protein
MAALPHRRFYMRNIMSKDHPDDPKALPRAKYAETLRDIRRSLSARPLPLNSNLEYLKLQAKRQRAELDKPDGEPAERMIPAQSPAKTSRPTAPSLPPEREKPVSVEHRRLKVRATLEALANSELWAVTPGEIAQHTGIKLSTLYRYLKHDTIRKTWERYKRESVGKTPANLEDLGDDWTFSLSTRK